MVNGSGSGQIHVGPCVNVDSLGMKDIGSSVNLEAIKKIVVVAPD